LYVRWLQLGSYLPLLRTRGGEGAGREGQRLPEPWEFGGEVAAYARVALAERRRLLPYLLTLARLARVTGAPCVRPVWWGAPEDRALRDCEDAFLLGDCLLVAPVFEAGTERRAVRLPRGRWYDTATERAYEGPGSVLVDTPPSRIAVLARAGSVLPVNGDDGPELEVWAPAPGRPGAGVFVPEPGDGGERAEVERFVVYQRGGRVVVRQERKEGLVASPYPVRVRGLPAGD
jgi:alpha-glucosidase